MNLKPILLSASILTALGDTQVLPPMPVITATGTTNLASPFVLNTSGLEHMEVTTNWTDFPPAQLKAITNHPLVMNVGYEYGLIVTNHLLSIIRNGQPKQIVISSETNELTVLERSYVFERVYKTPAWVVQGGR